MKEMKQTMFNRIQPQQSERSYSNQSKLKTVPQRKQQEIITQKKGMCVWNQPHQRSQTAKIFVTMNQTSQSYMSSYESSKMCLFEPRVFSDTQDIADELKTAVLL